MTFLPIPFAPRYQANELGEIKGPSGKILKPQKDRAYRHFSTWDRERGKARSYYIHLAVLEAFVGPCPLGMECRHLNGIGHDNQLDNLAWGTHEQNMADKVGHGTAQQRLTECGRGHEMVGHNILHKKKPSGKPSRSCRACYRITSRISRAGQRAARELVAP